MLKGTKLRVIKSKYFRAYQDRYRARDTYNLTQEFANMAPFFIIKVKMRKVWAMCQIFTKLNLFNVKKKIICYSENAVPTFWVKIHFLMR